MRLRKKLTKIFFVFCCGAGAMVYGLLLGGCATTGRGAQAFPYPTASFRGQPYFVLRTLCEREGVKWDYDPFSKALLLRKDAMEVNALIGSKTVLVNGEAKELSGPLEIQESVVYAPMDLRSYLTPSVCKIAPPAKVPSAYLRRVRCVVLDAGHGGRDPGAIGRLGLKEKGVVLDVAQRAAQQLRDCGLDVVLTRSSDEFIPLAQRAAIANEKKADLFVSIHANATASRWIEGFEVYYLTEAVDDDARALAAAENTAPEIEEQDFRQSLLSLKATLWDLIYTENRREAIELAYAISRRVSKKMNLGMLGVKGAPFAVLKGTRMPAVLVELGYLSNKEGERKLRDTEYRQRIAEAIAEGIMDFKRYAEGAR